MHVIICCLLVTLKSTKVKLVPKLVAHVNSFAAILPVAVGDSEVYRSINPTINPHYTGCSLWAHPQDMFLANFLTLLRWQAMFSLPTLCTGKSLLPTSIQQWLQQEYMNNRCASDVTDVIRNLGIYYCTLLILPVIVIVLIDARCLSWPRITMVALGRSSVKWPGQLCVWCSFPLTHFAGVDSWVVHRDPPLFILDALASINGK